MELGKIKNQREIRFFGIRRSGNHAVIGWIFDNYPGVVIHCNDINQKYCKKINEINQIDPYICFGNIHLKGVNYWTCKQKILGLIKNLITRNKTLGFSIKDPLLKKESIRYIKHKDCLILSYEDRHLAQVCSVQFESQRESLLGQSEKRYDILLLRDPYNLFASLMKAKFISPKNKQYYVDLWKEYAREYIGETNNLSQTKIVINYNQWFSDIEYRNNLSKKLEFQALNTTYKKVPSFGKGSSFSGTEFNNNAQEMPVLDRWKYFKDDAFYKEILADAELVNLSEQIFGAIASL